MSSLYIGAVNHTGIGSIIGGIPGFRYFPFFIQISTRQSPDTVDPQFQLDPYVISQMSEPETDLMISSVINIPGALSKAGDNTA